MTNEQISHDLALVYVQNKAKESDDYFEYLRIYRDAKIQFLAQLKREPQPGQETAP